MQKQNNKQRGGFLGFGSTSKKNNPKQKFKDVTNATYFKILEHRVKNQNINHEKLLKLTKEILILDPTNYKQSIDKIMYLSTTKTNNYNNFLQQKNWKQLISESEKDLIKKLALQQLEELNDSYTDTSKSVNYLSTYLFNKFNSENKNTQNTRQSTT